MSAGRKPLRETLGAQLGIPARIADIGFPSGKTLLNPVAMALSRQTVPHDQTMAGRA